VNYKVTKLTFLKSKKSKRAVIVMEATKTPLKHLEGKGRAIGWLRAKEGEQDELISEMKEYDRITFKVVQTSSQMDEITVTEVE